MISCISNPINVDAKLPNIPGSEGYSWWKEMYGKKNVPVARGMNELRQSGLVKTNIQH